MSGTQLCQTMQQLIMQSVNAAKLTDYILGTVESAVPLTIRISQKEVITEPYLVLTDAVRDYDVDIGVSHITENAAGGFGDAQYESHSHKYVGRKKIRVYNGLQKGESVILLRQSGAQEYCVLSRIFNHANLSGQWG